MASLFHGFLSQGACWTLSVLQMDHRYVKGFLSPQNSRASAKAAGLVSLIYPALGSLTQDSREYFLPLLPSFSSPSLLFSPLFSFLPFSPLFFPLSVPHLFETVSDAVAYPALESMAILLPQCIS